MKKAANRPKDQADLEVLEKLQAKKQEKPYGKSIG
jgi:hypothetical protein